MQDGSSGQKVLLKWSEDSSFASLGYSDRLGRSHQVPGPSCVDFHTTATPSLPNTIRISIDSSPPRRVQPAQPTGTQGEENLAHGIGVPPPLVGRPGASGELETQPPNCDSHSTTMVRVPGSSGDSGYHRESQREDAMVKIEPGMEVSAEEGSQRRKRKDLWIISVLGGAQMRKNQKRKIDRSIWKKNLYPLPRSFRGPLRIAPKNAIR